MIRRGIPNPDVLLIRGRVPLRAAEKFFLDLSNIKALKRFTGFPIGIPVPDHFDIEINVGPDSI
jgi:hypothetical protein